MHVRFAHVDDTEDAGALLAPLRAVATPVLDTVTEIVYPALGSIHADPTDPMPGMERSALLRELPDAALDALLAVAGPAGALPIALAEVRAMGGALGVPPETPNAVAGRDAAFTLFTVGVLVPPIADAVPGALETVVGAMAPWATGGALMNFAGGVDGAPAARVANAWTPAQRTRLAEIRAAYDPSGVFAPAARWAATAI